MDKETLKTWNKIAKLYEEKFMDETLYNDTYDQFCAFLSKSNSTILEIGCGPGNITKYLLNKHPDFKITAIDMAENMIELATINCPTVTFKVMDSREIDKLETTFDGIISGFCLPYLSASETEKNIADFNKLLNENGVLYLSFVEGTESMSGFKTSGAGDKVYFNYHLLENITNSLRANHFKNVNIIHKSFPRVDKPDEIHTIVIAEK